MNEIVKEYQDEIAERSITAKSYHAHNGNNGQKLGNRQLTRKEIEEKHGPVKTYTFDDFLTFPEFREMPLDWQVGYINHLQDKYDIGLTQINRDLFGQKDENMLRSHLKIKGILDKVNPDKRRARTKLHDFRRDIRECRMGAKKEEPETTMKFEFVTWEKFKTMPRKEQHLFINQVLDEYGRDIGIRGINREVFGKDNNALSGYLVRHNFDMQRDFNIKNGGNHSNPGAIAKLRQDVVEWKRLLGVKMAETAQELKSRGATNADISDIMNVAESTVRKLVSTEQKIDNSVNKEEKNEVVVKPPVFKTKQKVFSTCYIGNDFDMAEIEMLRKMFAGKTIQVEITITTDSIIEKYE